jgi:hypothetical protein
MRVFHLLLLLFCLWRDLLVKWASSRAVKNFVDLAAVLPLVVAAAVQKSVAETDCHSVR